MPDQLEALQTLETQQTTEQLYSVFRTSSVAHCLITIALTMTTRDHADTRTN